MLRHHLLRTALVGVVLASVAVSAAAPPVREESPAIGRIS